MLSGIVTEQRITYRNLSVLGTEMSEPMGQIPIIYFGGNYDYDGVTELAATAMEEANTFLAVTQQVRIPETPQRELN